MDQRFVFVESAVFQGDPLQLARVLAFMSREDVLTSLEESEKGVLHIVRHHHPGPDMQTDLIRMAELLLAYFKAPSIAQMQAGLGMPLIDLFADIETAQAKIRNAIEPASHEMLPLAFVRSDVLQEHRNSTRWAALEEMLGWHVDIGRRIAARLPT